MKKQNVKQALILGLILVSVFLSGCGTNPKKQIIGTWKADEEVIVFAKDGNMYSNKSKESVTYEINKKTLIMHHDGDDYICEFEIDGDILKITHHTDEMGQETIFMQKISSDYEKFVSDNETSN